MKFNLWRLDDHQELVEALFAAHREAAIANDNASKLCVQQAWGGSGRFENAMIAGLATIGSLHAPLTKARDLWEARAHWAEFVPSIVASKERIPGFGNSFWPSDPAFKRVKAVITTQYGEPYQRMNELWEIVAANTDGRTSSLSPNAAMYTAIVASVCAVPIGLEPALFAMARIPAWAEMCGEVQHPRVGGVR